MQPKSGLPWRPTRRRSSSVRSGSPAGPALPGSRLLLKIERGRIDAVAQTSRRRPVLKDVPQMRPAAAAGDLGADHPEAGVGRFGNGAVMSRRDKARPSGAGIEFRVRAEELRAAADAFVGSTFVMIPILAGERRLGAFLARDVILLGRQLTPPLGFRLVNFFYHLELDARQVG